MSRLPVNTDKFRLAMDLGPIKFLMEINGVKHLMRLLVFWLPSPK